MSNDIKAVIIDYGSGNLHSAHKAFVKALENAGKQGEVIISNNPDKLDYATHIVLPGVGAFGDCMKGLQAVTGMVAKLKEQVLKNKKPFLGICVGMQMLAEKGFENGEHEGLGWLKGNVEKIPAGKNLRIPQMGWNSIKIKKKSRLMNGLEDGSDFYFVHSYFMETAQDNITAITEYGIDITAVVEKENIFGVQFHPEKSQHNGLKLINNFLAL